MEKNLTTGSVFRNVILFSLPYLLSYFLQTLYGMADLFMIGQYDGVASTTAVSVGSQIMHMITVMIVGLAMGTTVSIAQAVGADNKKQASKAVGNTIVLFMGVAFVGMALLLMLVHPIVSVMSTPAEAVNGTVTYLTICFIGIPFITAYNIISSIFRGMGDSKSPMYFIAVACIANIGLDYLFMGAFKLGPAGAALGTTISQAISVLVSVIVIIKRKSVVLSKTDFKPQRDVMGKILYIGIPIAVQDGLIQVSFLTITAIANGRGVDVAAAVGIVEKIISFLFLVPSAMLSTVSALAAQNMGAGNHQRGRQVLYYAVSICIGFGVLCSIVAQPFADQIVGMFVKDSPQVTVLGGQYLRAYVFDCIFAGIHFCFSGYFSAYGKSIYSFIHNIISIVVVRIPGAWLASVMFPSTLYPMGLAAPLGSLLSALICIALYYHAFMKKTVIQSA